LGGGSKDQTSFRLGSFGIDARDCSLDLFLIIQVKHRLRPVFLDLTPQATATNKTWQISCPIQALLRFISSLVLSISMEFGYGLVKGRSIEVYVTIVSIFLV